eukprot:COSAG01_NODE_51591_length_353_cov_1.464567_1_plen_73_part_01
MRWQGQWFGHPLERMSQEVFDFVYTNREVENFLEPLEVGNTWRLTAFNRLQLIAQCAPININIWPRQAAGRCD